MRWVAVKIAEGGRGERGPGGEESEEGGVGREGADEEERGKLHGWGADKRRRRAAGRILSQKRRAKAMSQFTWRVRRRAARWAVSSDVRDDQSSPPAGAAHASCSCEFILGAELSGHQGGHVAARSACAAGGAVVFGDLYGGSALPTATAVLVALKPFDFWKVTRGEVKQGVIIGLFSSAGMLLQNDAMQFTSASTSAFLTQFYAILIPIYVAVRARRNPGWVVWHLLRWCSRGWRCWGGLTGARCGSARRVETLVASLFFMGQILWLEKEFAANRAERLTLVMFATEALVFAGLAGATAPDVATLVVPWTSPMWLGLTLTLTVFCTLGSFSIMNAWQPKITATEAGLIYCVEPIFGLVMALFLPAWFSAWGGITDSNETATANLLLGGGLITAANVLLQVKPPAKG